MIWAKYILLVDHKQNKVINFIKLEHVATIAANLKSQVIVSSAKSVLLNSCKLVWTKHHMCEFEVIRGGKYHLNRLYVFANSFYLLLWFCHVQRRRRRRYSPRWRRRQRRFSKTSHYRGAAESAQLRHDSPAAGRKAEQAAAVHWRYAYKINKPPKTNGQGLLQAMAFTCRKL